MNAERLLNVARALRESPAPADFAMARYVNKCGTPACALGHYAARPDLQGVFSVDDGLLVDRDTLDMCDYDSDAVCDHFGITYEQAEDLFGPDGCDGGTWKLSEPANAAE